MNRRQAHNAFQRGYYESALDKPAMQIADSPYVQNHVGKMISHGGLVREQTLLEVGAGLGKFSLVLARRGFQLTCNDLSPVLLDNLRQQAGEPMDTIACDIIDIGKHTDRKFDRVIGFFTLHHMSDLPAVFAAIASVLTPGGEICFIEPRGFHPCYALQIALTPRMTFGAEKGIVNMVDRIIHPAMEAGGLVPLPGATYGFFPPFLYNRKAGKRVEAFLERQRWLRWAYVFIIFRGRKPR